MIPFTIKKQLDSNRFNEYLLTANTTNQFTNYGYAVQLLEERARTMLKIDDSKVVIATSRMGIHQSNDTSNFGRKLN